MIKANLKSASAFAALALAVGFFAPQNAEAVASIKCRVSVENGSCVTNILVVPAKRKYWLDIWNEGIANIEVYRNGTRVYKKRHEGDGFITFENTTNKVIRTSVKIAKYNRIAETNGVGSAFVHMYPDSLNPEGSRK